MCSSGELVSRGCDRNQAGTAPVDDGPLDGEQIMRASIVAIALSGALLSVPGVLVSGIPAFAQSSAAYLYCLMTGPAQDCTFSSMAQCLASKRGNADFCEPNNWYSGPSSGRGRFRQ